MQSIDHMLAVSLVYYSSGRPIGRAARFSPVATFWIGLMLAPVGLACQALADEQASALAVRRTPVVTVFESAKDAVVNISSTQIVKVRSPLGIDQFFEDIFDLPRRTRELKRTSVGSGFVLHSAGYIITNAHVVARSAQQKVIFADDREFDAVVVAIDQERDLAVLKIEPDAPLVPLSLGRSEDLMVGETVIAIGNPLGYQHTVTAGVISALDRTLEISGDLSFHGLIQTDASINPGNSGGPLLNVLGELIGINTAIRGDAQNIGFAIPVDQLRRVLPELLDVERRYQIFTGVGVSTTAPCRIEHVAEDSPGQTALLRAGDVVTTVAGHSVDSGIDFHIALIGKKPGDHLRLDFQRDEQLRSTSLQLANRPRPDGAKLLWALLGIEAQPLTTKMARALGIRRVAGLMVTRLDRQGPAARAGLERGDIAVYLGRYQTGGLEDMGSLLENLRSGQTVRMTVLRVSGRVIYRLSADLSVR